MSVRPRRGVVSTFYSYKGGVGRSMSLANIAALLAKRGRRVLIVDWDLDAPGIERYFDESIAGKRSELPGLVDMVLAHARGERIAWEKALLTARPFADGAPIHIISAGRLDEGYSARASEIDWERAFSEHALGEYLEKLREEWTRAYDFILIDSRTGITDIGGICTVLLPDIVFVLFTTNHQSIEGVKQVTDHARTVHQGLVVDRGKLVFVPILGRDESQSEHDLAMEWRARAAAKLKGLFDDWLPRGVDALAAMNVLKVPYKPRWSFGEALPAVREGVTDPSGPGFAYDLLTGLLDNRLDWDAALEGNVGGLSTSIRVEAVTAQKSALELRVSELAAEATRLKAAAASAQRGRTWTVRIAVVVVSLLFAYSLWSSFTAFRHAGARPDAGAPEQDSSVNAAADAGGAELLNSGMDIRNGMDAGPRPEVRSPIVPSSLPPPVPILPPTSSFPTAPAPSASTPNVTPRAVTSEERSGIHALASREETGKFTSEGASLHQYRMSIEAPPAVTEQIQSVDYFFDHPTYSPQHKRSSYGPQFAQSYVGSGCVDAVVTVVFRDHTTYKTTLRCPEGSRAQ